MVTRLFQRFPHKARCLLEKHAGVKLLGANSWHPLRFKCLWDLTSLRPFFSVAVGFAGGAFHRPQCTFSQFLGQKGYSQEFVFPRFWRSSGELFGVNSY